MGFPHFSLSIEHRNSDVLHILNTCSCLKNQTDWSPQLYRAHSSSKIFSLAMDPSRSNASYVISGADETDQC